MKVGDWALLAPSKYRWRPMVGRIVRVTSCYVWFEKVNKQSHEERHDKTDVAAVFSTQGLADAALIHRNELLKPFEEREQALREAHINLNQERAEALARFHETVSPT